jgi:hypothetical protein
MVKTPTMDNLLDTTEARCSRRGGSDKEVWEMD